MTTSPYNPAIHHRRSIRLKGHDYAGGGLYFVTICAHRDFIAAARGRPFGAKGVGATSLSPSLSAPMGATRMSPVQELIAERMRVTEELCPYMRWEEAAIMPDHFHALIRVAGGHAPLGDIVGGFKAAVSRELRRAWRGERRVAGEALLVPTTALDINIWHRNYYEMIVRDADAEKNIAAYIRLNPWRCVMDFGGGLRGMGNPTLWQAEKLGVLCSRNALKPKSIPNAPAFFSGFHSPMEKEIFAKLLELKKPAVWCPAWGLDRAALAPGVREALEENRMLILEMSERNGDLASAEARNRFVLKNADRLWLPYVAPGGMLERLVREMAVQEKIINHGTH